MSKTRSSGRRADTMRAAILAGARRLFLAHGFERTSMDAVAGAIAVSKMTVYRHFRSKEALFSGIIGEMCEAIHDPEIDRAMARLPLRKALETFGRHSLETIFDLETLALHRLMVAEGEHFPELRRMFYDRGPGTNVAMLAAFLERHADDPLLRHTDAKQAASEFMALLRGYEHMRALLGLDGPPPKSTRERQVRRAVDHVLRKEGE